MRHGAGSGDVPLRLAIIIGAEPPGASLEMCENRCAGAGLVGSAMGMVRTKVPVAATVESLMD